MNKIVITRMLFSIILYNMICIIKYYFHLTKKDSYLEIQKIMKLWKYVDRTYIYVT